MNLVKTSLALATLICSISANALTIEDLLGGGKCDSGIGFFDKKAVAVVVEKQGNSIIVSPLVAQCRWSTAWDLLPPATIAAESFEAEKFYEFATSDAEDFGSGNQIKMAASTTLGTAASFGAMFITGPVGWLSLTGIALTSIPVSLNELDIAAKRRFFSGKIKECASVITSEHNKCVFLIEGYDGVWDEGVETHVKEALRDLKN